MPGQGQVLVGEIPSATWTIGTMTCPSFPPLEEIWGYSLTIFFFLESVQIPCCWSWNPNQSLFIHWGEPINYVDLAPSIRGTSLLLFTKVFKNCRSLHWPPFSASPHNTWSLGRGSWLRETGNEQQISDENPPKGILHGYHGWFSITTFNYPNAPENHLEVSALFFLPVTDTCSQGPTKIIIHTEW